MALLVITNQPLTSKLNGYDLRVWHVCQALAQRHALVLLSLPAAMPASVPASAFAAQALFREVRMAAPLARWSASPRRHLRLNEANYFAWGYPAFVASVTEQINALCASHDISAVVAFGGDLLGLLKAGAGRQPVLLDVCDSTTLTMRRAMPGLAIWRRGLTYLRWCRLEGSAPARCDQVVTINHADTATLQRLSGGRANLSTLPNGVEPCWLQGYREAPAVRRGVAFWGNLNFPPNRDAVQFFYANVYLPHLKPAGIAWCVAGANAEPWLVEAARHDPLLRLTGFVADLPALLADYPVMVNPMRIGSGLKNKVLEAYACGLAVVSTRLGMEAIDGAEAGATYLAAESGLEFYQAIIALLDQPARQRSLRHAARQLVLSRYTWDIVGARWCDLVDAMHAAHARTAPVATVVATAPKVSSRG